MDQQTLVKEEARRLNEVACNSVAQKDENKRLASAYRDKAETLIRTQPDKAKELLLKSIDYYKNVITYSSTIDERLITESIIEEINRQLEGIERARHRK